MNFKEFKEKYIVFITIFSLYILITIFPMIYHYPLFDEAHAWVIAKFLNFNNWVDIIKLEGHPLLWYLLLVPFAKFTDWYPYPMLIINYLFCILALLVVWIKSPFTNILKIAITFSAMFLLKFSVVARGYTVGIFLLFLICYLRKQRLERPLLYSLLLGLTLNTNVMCAIGASWFAIEYLYSIITNKLSLKFKIFSISILSLFSGLMVFPYLNGCGTLLSRTLSKLGLKYLIIFFSQPLYYLLIIYLLLLAILLIKIKDVIPKLFLIYTNTIMLILFKFFYPGFYHHFIFFFVYFIIFLWISNAEEIVCKMKKINIINILMVLLLIPPININLELDNIYNPKGTYSQKKLATYMKNEPIFKGSTIYVEGSIYHIIPYFPKDVEVIETCQLTKLSWDTLNRLNCIDNHELMIKNSGKRTFLLSQSIYNNSSSKMIKEVNKVYIYEYK